MEETQSQIWRDAKKDFPEFEVTVLGASRYNRGWVYFVCHLSHLTVSKGRTIPEYYCKYETADIDYWMPIVEPPKPAEQ